MFNFKMNVCHHINITLNDLIHRIFNIKKLSLICESLDLDITNKINTYEIIKNFILIVAKIFYKCFEFSTWSYGFKFIWKWFS